MTSPNPLLTCPWRRWLIKDTWVPSDCSIPWPSFYFCYSDLPGYLTHVDSQSWVSGASRDKAWSKLLFTNFLYKCILSPLSIINAISKFKKFLNVTLQVWCSECTLNVLHSWMFHPSFLTHGVSGKPHHNVYYWACTQPKYFTECILPSLDSFTLNSWNWCFGTKVPDILPMLISPSS